MADLAERSIDAQYFIWSADSVGTLLIERLVRAADRGVRVRLLVDDIYLTGGGTVLATLDAHPQIEIKIYNPVGARNPLRLGRRVDFLMEFGRLNHRMHNKLFVADNQVAIMGGRNIADAYFGVDPKFNVRDMDVLAAGPVVPQLSAGFDAYWNSRWAIPMSTLKRAPSPKAMSRAYERLEKKTAQRAAQLPFAVDTSADENLARLAALREQFVWARGEAVWADPEAGPSGMRDGQPTEVGRKLTAVVDETRTELISESPYLVPASELAMVRQLRSRNVRIRMLTNSLASTDEPPAYAIYATDYRRMLDAGVEMYEVRSDAESRRRHTTAAGDAARLGLHAKLAVFDRRVVYIGSFNFDPRSLFLNTEVALFVYSPALAQRMLELVERDFAPENAWRVELDGNGSGGKPAVVWITQDSDEEVRHRHPPETSVWRRLGARIYALLPIRGQL
jgi:cardiolipin synthase C